MAPLICQVLHPLRVAPLSTCCPFILDPVLLQIDIEQRQSAFRRLNLPRQESHCLITNISCFIVRHCIVFFLQAIDVDQTQELRQKGGKRAHRNVEAHLRGEFITHGELVEQEVNDALHDDAGGLLDGPGQVAYQPIVVFLAERAKNQMPEVRVHHECADLLRQVTIAGLHLSYRTLDGPQVSQKCIQGPCPFGVIHQGHLSPSLGLE